MLFYQVNKTSVYCRSVSASEEISAAFFAIISPQRNSAIVGPLLQIIWFFLLRQEVLFSLFFKGHASLFVSHVHLFFLSLSHIRRCWSVCVKAGWQTCYKSVTHNTMVICQSHWCPQQRCAVQHYTRSNTWKHHTQAHKLPNLVSCLPRQK